MLDLRADLDAPPKLPGYSLRLVDSSTLELDISKDQYMNSFFAELSGLGIEVLSLRNKVNRLEGLYLSLLRAEEVEVGADSATNGHHSEHGTSIR